MIGRRQIPLIRDHIERLRGLSDLKLSRRSADLRYLAMSGTTPKTLIPEAFSLVVEASRRTTGIVHRDVQLLCGIAMAYGDIAEMKTGEGKTMTATLVAYLLALYGRGVHVITFNDYLATRDHEITRPILTLLGLSSSVLTQSLSTAERYSAYRSDVTYGTTKEFGFDFLRDRVKTHELNDPRESVMRGTHFALIDEADSILIDEARTPLVIGIVSQTEQMITQECCTWAARHAPSFIESLDFNYEQSSRSIELTATGFRKLRALPENRSSKLVSIQQLSTYIKNSIKVLHDFHRDKHYTIRNGEVVIIDELTGRLAEGRKWQLGLHQAIEAKEGLQITESTKQAAAITIPSLFKLYPFVCGMTGTAHSSRIEFRKVYQKSVRRIPTHHPPRRVEYPAKVFEDQEQKYSAIVEETIAMVKSGRSVLIGSRTVAGSERLSDRLSERGVAHSVLNAHHLEKEALIVEKAGQSGCVTVATNMAGRGTDIKLAKSVRDAGGLHVILTELNDNQRIDWQLIGRGSRQGDPGSFRIFLSLDDEILKVGFGLDKAQRLKTRLGKRRTIEPTTAIRYFRLAQRRAERNHMIDRLRALRYEEDRQKSSLETGTDAFLTAIHG